MGNDIIITDELGSGTIEYIEITNSALGTIDGAQDALVIAEYNPNVPNINPPYVAENQANKRQNLLNPNSVTYPSTLGVANGISGITNLFSVYTGITAPATYVDKIGFNLYTGTTVPNYVNTVISSGITYNLTSPSVISVGGISAGTVLSGKTVTEILEELLVPTLYPTLTAPSNSISITPSGLFEIGCIIPSLTITSCFNPGCINPQYSSSCDKRSNGANYHCFIGNTIGGSYLCSSQSLSKSISTYSVVSGSQSWQTYVNYSGGTQPKDSRGGNYCLPLSTGNTSTCCVSITGSYPIWTTCSNISGMSKISLYNMATANNIQISLVAEVSPNKQRFEIPCAWLGAPVNRPLVGVLQCNTLNGCWEYPGGSAACSLNFWNTSASIEFVQGNTVDYCRYTYNGADRNSVNIRLVF